MDILNTLGSLPWQLGAFIMIALFVIFAILILTFVRKVVNQDILRAHHDVAGFVFANLGVLYAVLLGFTVVSVQQRFDKMKENVQVEASYLAQLYRDAEVFSKADHEKIRKAIQRYSKVVINEEWYLTHEEIERSSGHQAFSDIWTSYYQANINDDKQKLWYGESIGKLNQLMNARIIRILGTKESLGPEIWTFLFLGGLVLISFICFFGLKSLTLHIVMASILAACTAFLLFVIYSLDTAFSGAVSITPEALSRVVATFD